MRTTLDLEEDIILVAKQLSRQRRTTMGKIVSSLVRKALEPTHQVSVRNGVPLFTPEPGAPKPSLTLINRLRDQA